MLVTVIITAPQASLVLLGIFLKSTTWSSFHLYRCYWLCWSGNRKRHPLVQLAQISLDKWGLKRTGCTINDIAAADIFFLSSTLNDSIFLPTVAIAILLGVVTVDSVEQWIQLNSFSFSFTAIVSVSNALLVVINRRGTDSLSNRLTSTGGACSHSTTGFTTTNRRRKFRFTWFFYNKKEVLD